MFDVSTAMAITCAAAPGFAPTSNLDRIIARQRTEMAAERERDTAGSDPDDADEERRRDLDEHGDET